MARKPAVEGSARTRMVLIRLTPDEHEAIASYAASAEQSIADVFRRAVFRLAPVGNGKTEAVPELKAKRRRRR